MSLRLLTQAEISQHLDACVALQRRANPHTPLSEEYIRKFLDAGAGIYQVLAEFPTDDQLENLTSDLFVGNAPFIARAHALFLFFKESDTANVINNRTYWLLEPYDKTCGERASCFVSYLQSMVPNGTAKLFAAMADALQTHPHLTSGRL